MKSNSEDSKNHIKTLAASCVRCGLCISTCPTYSLEHTEAESPRGRIALANALATNALELTPMVHLHLDQCLRCRTCEAVCPADVKFGELIDETQSLITQQKPPAFFSWVSFVRYVLTKPPLQKIAHHCLYWLERFKIRALLRNTGLLRCFKLKTLDQYLPRIPKPHSFQTTYPSKQPFIRKVGLLLGCATNVFSQETLMATIYVLNALGYEVEIPPQQTCCGALALHAGDSSAFMKLLKQNTQSFSVNHLAAIISIASGCTSTLGEYHQYLPESAEFSHKIQDPTTFILKALEQRNTPFQLKPLMKRVAVHTPCTLKNVRKGASDVIQLLKYIPDITLFVPETQPACCGGAGEYALLHPEKAALLANQTDDALKKMGPDLIVTSNIGCELQLQQRQKTAAKRLPVMHPIALFAEQMVPRTLFGGVLE